MAFKSDAYFRQLAAAALRSAGIDDPPVPVEVVAMKLGIPVRIVNLPAFFQGATINEDGMPVLLVNGVRDEMGRRRTIAHMLGHVLIVLDDPDIGFPRGAGDHRPADIVADELIMPGHLVTDQAQKWFNDYRYLARLFGVGETEMEQKMRDLGLIRGPQGIMWDY